MTQSVTNLRIEQTNDGRQAVVADVVGGVRILFGYLGDADTHIQIGGADRVAKKVQ